MIRRSACVMCALLWASCSDGSDPGPDADTEVVEAPEPGAFVAGLASSRIPAPLGIGTAGYGSTNAGDSKTPFAELYPGTKRIWGPPTVEVVAPDP